MFDGPWESCMLVRGLNPSECASWVQAWGAIAAIIASAAVVLLVQRHEAQRERAVKNAEEVRILKIVGQFVFDVRAKLRDIEEHPLPHLHRTWTAVEAPVASLDAVPFDRYPAENAAFAVAVAMLSYGFMREAYATLDEGEMGTSEQIIHIEASRHHALGGFFRAEQEIEAALVARGSRLPRMQINFEHGVSVRTLEADPVLGSLADAVSAASMPLHAGSL
ncbi:hypothetical protein [Variovorax sp. dw_308]|uniref:hypothetical protein n=1 Tax=Variovorax sp. dw_308 TaxID=2721546 RepID=UPI001C491149|nr:hypothetical protein [Variovorax sp. dw_308]